MRHLPVLLFVLLIAVAPNRLLAASPKTLRILFIGNSYTGGVRGTVQQTLKTMPAYREVHAEFVTPGGRKLHQHLANEELMAKIEKGKWDYVVLQEQSQLPSFPLPHSDVFFKASEGLCKRIHKAGVKPVFFMTWGRRDGDKRNIKVNPDFVTMQKNLSRSYRRAAKDNKALVLPVGDVFAELHRMDQELWKSLYAKDGSHPSRKGGVVFTCVLLHHLFKDDLKKVKMKAVSVDELKKIKAASKPVKPVVKPGG